MFEHVLTRVECGGRRRSRRRRGRKRLRRRMGGGDDGNRVPGISAYRQAPRAKTQQDEEYDDRSMSTSDEV